MIVDTRFFPPGLPPPDRNNPTDPGAPQPVIQLEQIQLSLDWYACDAATGYILQWGYGPDGNQAIFYRDKIPVLLRDPFGQIKWDIAAEQDVDGEWFIPSGYFVTAWQPADAKDGHWRLLHAGQQCTVGSGSGPTHGSRGGEGSQGGGVGHCCSLCDTLHIGNDACNIPIWNIPSLNDGALVGGQISVDVFNRALVNVGNVVSVDWVNHLLVGGGTTWINWSGSGFLPVAISFDTATGNTQLASPIVYFAHDAIIDGNLTVLGGINVGAGAAPGLSVTVPLAKLTALGADGSLTFIDGVLTARVDPT